MGNINYNNLMCENYYCQSVSFKPEWLSESSWNIIYKYIKDSENKIKPYNIEKGILKIKDVLPNNLCLSKKMLINFNDIRNIIIPTNFKYNISNNKKINIYYIFSNFEFKLLDIANIYSNNSLFYIKIELLKNKIFINRSYDKKIIKQTINSKKINSFNIEIENNHNLLLVTECLLNKYEEKYINPFVFEEDIVYYLNLFIETNDVLSNNEYIELNFE